MNDDFPYGFNQIRRREFFFPLMKKFTDGSRGEAKFSDKIKKKKKNYTHIYV